MEKYLLDTHAILWYFQGNENLPKKIRTIIESKSCFYSIISFWEIAIKQKLGKLDSSFSIQELESMCTSKYTNCSYHIKIHRNNKIFAFNSQRPFRPTFNCSSKKLKLNINYQRHVHSAIRCENFMVNSPRNFLFSKPLQGLGIRLADTVSS